jgi:hypothetical protein
MTTTPKWFLPVAALALLWNLVGCWAYLQDVRVSPEELAKMSADLQALRAARPMWSVAATAIAVWGGALGCLGLILRKRWAVPLLVASLAGCIVQDLSFFLLAQSHGGLGAQVIGLQGMVLAIAAALVLLGRKASARGWLA